MDGIQCQLQSKQYIITIWIQMQPWEMWYCRFGLMNQHIGKRIIFCLKFNIIMKWKKNKLQRIRKSMKKNDHFTKLYLPNQTKYNRNLYYLQEKYYCSLLFLSIAIDVWVIKNPSIKIILDTFTSLKGLVRVIFILYLDKLPHVLFVLFHLLLQNR